MNTQSANRMWPFSGMSLSTASLWFDVANYALVVSLVLGVIATFVIVRTVSIKESYWDVDRENAKERIATLAAETEASKAAIAEANARALEAQAQLAKFKSPRSMTPEQQSRISTKLGIFKGTRFDMAVLPGDPEAALFLGQISKTLQSSGWEWIEFAHPTGPLQFTYTWPGLPNVGQLGGVGIDIFINSDHFSEFASVSQALATILAEEGFSNGKVGSAVPEQGIPNHDTIHIIIGKKPL